jgi:hypothetical protein
MSLVAIGNIPSSFPPDQRDFLQTLVDAVKNTQPTVVPPKAPTNLQVTAAPGSNIVQFTRSDGDTYALYKNSAPSKNGATRVDLGRANQYVDNVGAAGVLVFYWVVAKLGPLTSASAGPVSATTAALNAVITPPVAPNASQTPTLSNIDHQVIPGHPSMGAYNEDL